MKKRILMTVSCALIAAAGLEAQTAEKPAGGTAAPRTAAAATNQDLNVRAYIELLRTDLKKSKSQVMGAVMQLDAEDAAKFWPVYKEFEADLSGIGDKVVALVKEYAANYDNMTPDVADRLANNLLNVESERNSLKKQYYERVKKALDPITATRFLQVENQLERLMDLQIASELPVIRGK